MDVGKTNNAFFGRVQSGTVFNRTEMPKTGTFNRPQKQLCLQSFNGQDNRHISTGVTKDGFKKLGKLTTQPMGTLRGLDDRQPGDLTKAQTKGIESARKILTSQGLTNPASLSRSQLVGLSRFVMDNPARGQKLIAMLNAAGNGPFKSDFLENPDRFVNMRTLLESRVPAETMNRIMKLGLTLGANTMDRAAEACLSLKCGQSPALTAKILALFELCRDLPVGITPPSQRLVDVLEKIANTTMNDGNKKTATEMALSGRLRAAETIAKNFDALGDDKTALLCRGIKLSNGTRDIDFGVLNGKTLPTKETLGFEPKLHLNVNGEFGDKFDSLADGLDAMKQLLGDGFKVVVDRQNRQIHIGHSFREIMTANFFEWGLLTGNLSEDIKEERHAAYQKFYVPWEEVRTNLDSKLPKGADSDPFFSDFEVMATIFWANPAIVNSGTDARLEAQVEMAREIPNDFVPSKTGDAKMQALNDKTANMGFVDKLTAGFDNSPVVFMGESHGSIKPQLLEMVEDLKLGKESKILKSGVTALAVEEFAEDSYRTQIEDFLKNKESDEFPPSLHGALLNSPFSGMRELLIQAKKSNLEIVFINKNALRSMRDSPAVIRAEEMNAFARLEIRGSLMRNPTGKVLAIIGAAHGEPHKSEGLRDSEFVPGLCDVFNAPMLRVGDSSGLPPRYTYHG